LRFLAAEPGPNFSVSDVFAGWTEALRGLGHDVIEYPFSSTLTFYGAVLVEAGQGRFRKALNSTQATELAVDRLCAALYKTRPDVLLSVSGFFLPTALFDTARMYGTKVVIIHTESPYEDGRQLELAAHADLNFINDPTNLEKFRSVAPTHYMPHAYRPHIHKTGPPDPVLACDLGFVGTGFPSRADFLERMDLAGLDVILAGNWAILDEESLLRAFVPHDINECLDNKDTVSIYQSAKAGLNLYRREAETAHLAEGWAMGPREVEMAASGLFFLRDPRPESDELLGMLPTFDSPEDASEKLRWWLPKDSARQALAAQAREAVAFRTFDNHAADLLRYLEKG
jgi:spore maturation protein CgeB